MNAEFAEPKIYTTGQEFFPVFEDVIARAKEEILICVYAIDVDAVGKKFINLLCDASRRGMRVRVLFDNVEILKDSSDIVKNALQKSGADVAIFRPLKAWLPRHPLAAACRNHGRLFLIDRSIIGLGGMSFSEICLNREDLFILCRIANPEGAVAYFEKLWRLSSCVSIRESLSFGQASQLVNGSTILVSGPGERDQEIYRWLGNAIDGAKKRICVATPFFFPDRSILLKLMKAKSRGVNVEIITPLRTDKPRYDWFRAVPIPYLAKRGIQWYGTRTYFHTKLCIVDSQWMFGSANIDIICTQRNYELNLCGTSLAVLEKLEICMRDLKKNVRTILTQPAPLYIRILINIFHRLAEFIFKLT